MLTSAPYPPYGHRTAQTSKGAPQTAFKKRRQSIVAETTNCVHAPGQWTYLPHTPVFSNQPMEGVIPTSPSIVASHHFYGQPAQPHPHETKRVRFDNPIAVSQEIEEDLEYSHCMQRRLEQDVYYPYHPGYANQGGVTLAPPMPIPGYPGHSSAIRWSGVPVWAPGVSVQHHMTG